MNGFLIVVGM